MKSLKKLLIDITDKKKQITNIRFCINNKKGVEYFELNVQSNDGTTQIVRGLERKVLTLWQQMLELSNYDNEERTSDELEGLVDKLESRCIRTRELSINEIRDVYIEFLDKDPFLLVTIIKAQDIFVEGEEYNDKIENLIIDLKKLISKIRSYNAYITDSLILPYEHGKKIDPLRLLFNYEMYCNSAGINSILSKSIFFYEDTYKNTIVNNRYIDIFNVDDKNQYTEIVEPYLVDEIFIDDSLSFYDEIFISGIEYLIDKELIPKKCNLCGRFFLNKYSYMANYCNVLYRDTKDTCQEYVSKINYKSKVSLNRINNEYSRVYNRLYSRVRRNTMKKEDAKFDKLKEARDAYILKFELSSDEKQQSEIVEEFLLEIKRLYISDDEKEKILKLLGFNEEQLVIFCSLARNLNLDQFRNILDIQINTKLDNEYMNSSYNEDLELFYKITSNLSVDEWREIQSAI